MTGMGTPRSQRRMAGIENSFLKRLLMPVQVGKSGFEFKEG